MAYEIYEKLRVRYGALLCKTRIGETVALAASPMHGKDVFEFAPHSPGAADYRALVQELWESGFFS
jgi:chromosome partitioning protein